MSTPLYTTDVQKITDRTPKTSLVDADVFVVANSSGVLAPLTKVNAKATLGIDANATAIALKADKDADAVTGNFAMFDASGTPVDSGKKDADYEDADATILKQANIVNDLTTGGTTVPLSAEQGKVLKTAQLLKAEKTELNALNLAHLSELTILKDRITAQNNRINTLLAEVYTDDPILSYASTVANGVGYVSGSAVDISATVQDGGFNALGIKGETLTNLVAGAGIIATGTVTFASILNHIYFDTLHGTKVTGTGSDITLTNDSGVTADMAVYNITSLGIPTVADAILVSRLPYIVGTESVGEQVLQVRGKNLFDKDSHKFVRGNYTSGGLNTMTTGTASSGLIMVSPSTAYRYTKTGWYGSDPYYVQYDNNKVYISTSYGSSFTTGTTTRYIRIQFNTTPGIVISPSDLLSLASVVMLNLGSTALPYEAYKEQLAYLPPTLRRVPNGTQDEMRQATVGWEHEKNVQEYVLQASDVNSIDTSQNVNTDIVACVSLSAVLSPPSLSTIWGNALSSSISVVGWPQMAGQSYIEFDNLASIEKCFTTPSRLAFVVAKGTYASLADARADLAGTVIYYQLATPVTTQYENIPHLPCYDGGSTTRFAGTKKVVLYGTGITFTKNVLSVTQATKFYGGVETDITSDAVISGTGVTFAGAEATAVVLIKVAYDVDEPIGELSSVPTVENTKSRLADLESRVTALEV